MSPATLLARLNDLGRDNGIGRLDLVENRFVGMKSRGIYETPGGTLLYAAHSELEQLTLDRRTLALKDAIAPRYADLVYEGRWWSTERVAMDALVDVTQQAVTGEIRLKLHRGNVTVAGRWSAQSLYDERFVTFGEDDVYEQSDAAGFIRLYGLSGRVRALKALRTERSERRERTGLVAAAGERDRGRPALQLRDVGMEQPGRERRDLQGDLHGIALVGEAHLLGGDLVQERVGVVVEPERRDDCHPSIGLEPRCHGLEDASVQPN